MADYKPTHTLARLEVGFRTDAAHLKELERTLALALQCARDFGRKQGSPDSWNTDWNQQWDKLEGILRRIRVLMNEMDDSIEGSDSARLKKALEAWETFQEEDARLLAVLNAIRMQATGLNAGVRKDWNSLAHPLESQLETIYACAQASRIRLELLKKHSKEEVDRQIQDLLSKLPNRFHADGSDSEKFEQEYRTAASELEQEHHKFFGFVDAIKGLLMWIETTEERVRKNRSLAVAEA
jgi:hypothetical protein